MNKRLSILILMPAFIFICEKSSFAQWQQTSGPTSGAVSSFVVVDSNLFAATAGVFLLDKNEERWKAMSSGLPINAGISNFAVLGSRIYAGGNGIFLSDDLGKSWKSVSSGLHEHTYIFDLAFMDTILFASAQIASGMNDSYGTVYRSLDYGKSWQEVNSGLVTPGVNAIEVLDSCIFIGTDNGVYISKNSGENWFCLSNNLQFDFFAKVNNDLYAGGYLINGFYKWDKANSKWETLNPDIKIRCFANIDSTFFAGHWGKIYNSSDGGRNWELILDLSGRYYNVFSLQNVGKRLFAGIYGGGVYLSDDLGASWRTVNTGLADAAVNDILYFAQNLYAGISVATGPGRIFCSSDQGKSWVTSDSGVISAVYDFESIESDLFAATSSGVFRSENRGENWIEVNNGLPVDWGASELFAMGNVLFVESSDGVYASSDRGDSWTPLKTGLPEDTRVHAFAQIDSNLYLGSTEGVFLLSEDHSYWMAKNNGFPPNFDVINLISSGTKLFAGTRESGIFRSVDYGENWTMVGTGSIYPNISKIAVFENTLFVATTGNGIYFSKNNGESFVEINEGLPGFSTVNCLEFDDEHIYAGINNKGIWRRPLSEIITSLDNPDKNDIPMVFDLEQNYPNPFNARTTIVFHLLKSSYIEIKVYNVFGQRIKSLLSQNLQHGVHKIIWDGTDYFGAFVSSGIYIVELSTLDFRKSIKTILLQ